MSGTSGKSALAAVASVGKKTTTRKTTTRKTTTKPTASASTSGAKTETSKLVSEIIETAENAAQEAQGNMEQFQSAIKDTTENLAKSFSEAMNTEAPFGMSAFDYLMDTAENMQNKTAEMADSIKETHETNKANVALIQESACDTMTDISSAYFETIEKSISCESMSDLANLNMEYASKVQHACNDMMSIMGKASYSTMRETMSLWTSSSKK